MKKLLLGMALISAFFICMGDSCENQPSADDIQRQQQETLLKEGTAQTGMPAIKNFRERKMMKDILELRDQTGLTTYVYIVAEMTGKLVYLGQAIGFGLPYSTQFTNPQKVESYGSQWGAVIAQADPNGLFSPASAEGTWILMKDPNGKSVKPVYVEPRVIVSPFKLNIE